MNSRKMLLDGNEAAANALMLAKVGVISTYPITPQSPIAEKLAEFVAQGRLKAKYILVESEHSALSCAIGAQLTGIRAATATSSVGLAYMHEVLGVASGCRIPIIMPVVNRALVSPWSLWCDHQDTMAERDSGWLQFYVENVQEILDILLIAYKIAEHKDILLPAMVCMDGFFVSHSNQSVMVPDQQTVDNFLPNYESKNLFLDPRNPMFINDLTSPDEFSEMRFQQKMAFKNALKIIPEIQEEFFVKLGRKYEMLEPYQSEDADVILVTIGSMSGTAKYVVKKMRKKGNKVGILKISSFRPFPVQQLQKAVKEKIILGVLDRSAGLGAQGGPVYLEVTSALKNREIQIYSYIVGLGGRDISEITIERIFTELMQIKKRQLSKPRKTWIDSRENALDIRLVKLND
ncbi:MAG: pyruvate ferredoxin oxidoreductase [Promethearchaeota archaeon]